MANYAVTRQALTTYIKKGQQSFDTRLNQVQLSDGAAENQARERSRPNSGDVSGSSTKKIPPSLP